MSASGTGFDSVFRANVPPGYLERVVKEIADAYVRAPIECDRMKMEEPEADNQRPWLRRNFIERGLREAAKQFPSIKAEVIKGREALHPNWWNHTLIKCGGVWITQCKVQHPEAFPRVSFAREFYAKRNTQKQLFQRGDELPEPPDQCTQYAIIIHGKVAGSGERAGFIQVRFPVRGAQLWHRESIDLLDDEFPAAGAGVYQPDPSDLPPDEKIPQPSDPKINDDRIVRKKNDKV